MFGLPSLGKLIVLALIVGAVWYAFKLHGRMEQMRRENERLSRRDRGGQRGYGVGDGRAAPEPRSRGRSTQAMTEELVPCRVCGTYVSSAHPRRCDRRDCPY